MEVDIDEYSDGEKGTLTAPSKIHKFKNNQNYLDITDQASWSVSSSKGKYGVMNLIDNSLDTFWQSEAKQPHTISMEFNRKMKVSQILFFVDFDQDESYTPQKIIVKAGNGHNDLRIVEQITLKKPQGWINICLDNPTTALPLRTFLLQMIIQTNLQNGQNSHLRQVRLLAPVTDDSSGFTAFGITTNSRPSDHFNARTEPFNRDPAFSWCGSLR